MYLHQKISRVYLLCSYCIANTFAAIEVDTGQVRDWFGGMGRFSCKGSVNSVIINVITEINHRCKYMQVFLKYNVKTCMHTISALYQMNN